MEMGSQLLQHRNDVSVPIRHLNRGPLKMIKKVQGGYKVLSEKGKNLGGPYKTKKEAEKRLREVEYFKHK
jgi:hypothetical protein